MFDFRQRKEIFLFSDGWGGYLSILWLPGFFTPRVNRPGHDARPRFTHLRLLQWLILHWAGSNNAMRLHTFVLTMYSYGLTHTFTAEIK
jgi:hypothetical protein